MLRYIVIAWFLLTTCYAQDAARMDQVVQSYVSKGQFMGSVLVARGNDVLFTKGYGSANLEWNIPNTPRTRFRLGSITKQFTAAAVLLLEERGKLNIEDPIGKYLPDAPAAWDKVTIFHVLTHTSGIPSFTNYPEYPRLKPFPATPEQLVALFRDRPLEFASGEKMQYSNSGYVLLGYLIEKVSGETYQDFIHKNIFQPLDMKDTGYDSNSGIIAHRASGYAPGPDGPLNAGFIHMSVPFSAGALYSTTEDLLCWELGLLNGKLISAKSLTKMTTPFKDNYAFGLAVHIVNGRKVIEHGGGIEGFNTYLAYIPDDKLTVVVLGNLQGSAPEQISRNLVSLARGETVVLPSERKEVAVLPEILRRYVGTYELAPKVNMMITLEGDQLMAQVSGQGKAPVFPHTETGFFYKVVNAEIEFTRGPEDTIVSLILHQNGRDTKAPRISDHVAVRKEIAVPPRILAQYVGAYELQPGFDLVITLEGDQLISQATGQPKIPIFAETETKFFPKLMEAEIEFLKDDNGTVTHLMLHQGGVEIKAPRK
ncbi:MAG: serine hydrolase [Acidobacteria bacterium]|nr:serine hydrolase [Acidobacteriota bacterium]